MGRYESIPRVSPMSVDHRHAFPFHGVNKAVDKGHWTDSLRNVILRFVAVIVIGRTSFSFLWISFPQVLFWIQIRTEGRSWYDSDVLLEKISGGSGIVLLKHAMLVTVK